MTETTRLHDLLACPRCDKAPLGQTDTGYRCGACRIDFPRLGEIPWLFADPGSTLGEWRQRLDLLLKQLERDAARYAEARERTTRQHTRRRLSALEAAAQDHARRLGELLSPLALGRLQTNYETYLALRTRLPGEQGLATYYANVHRDWAWGREENEHAFELIGNALADEPALGKAAVLGAGAGRLAYDVHMRLPTEITVVSDFNPMLLLLARHIMSGESIELYEFPIAPKSVEDAAVLRTLAAEEPVRAGLFFVFGDALRPPFRKGSFDTIVTPWLIDILPEDLATFCARLNALLADGGRWINFGSLSFHHRDPALCYSPEECLELLEASGFTVAHRQEAAIPYMCSPASRHARRETVVTWTARKTAPAPAVARHMALPDWIVKGDEPIPLLPSFQVQAATTRIYAFIMSLIDGRRSLQSIAGLLADQGLMRRAEAEPAIRSFLIKMFEEAQRPSGY